MTGNEQHNYREGTSQTQRLLAGLKEGYVNIDERTIADWLRFARAYGRELKYFDINNQEQGNWDGFIQGDIEEIITFLQNPDAFINQAERLTQLRRPHFVLFLIFLKLLTDHHQKQLNQLSWRHLDFYYREALRFKPKAARPDQVFIMMELAKNAKDRFPLEKGTELFAGKDATGKDLIYRTNQATFINRARISQLKTVFAHRLTDQLENYDIPEGIIPLLRLVIGQNSQGESVTGGDLPPLDPFNTGQVPETDEDFESQLKILLDFLRFTVGEGPFSENNANGLDISFITLRKLIALKNKRAEEAIEWIEINALLAEMQNGATATFDTPNDFITNFQAATGVDPLASPLFDAFQNVRDLYDLHEELLLAEAEGNIQAIELKEFISTYFYGLNAIDEARVADFKLMMEKRRNIRDDWNAMWELLSNALSKDFALDLEQANFDNLLTNAYRNGLHFNLAHPTINDIDQYYAALRRAEQYFYLRAEEILFLLGFFEKESSKSEEKRIYELLTKAYQKKYAATLGRTTKQSPIKTSLLSLHANADATTLITNREAEDFPRWRTFGASLDDNQAAIGFAVASPLLELAEGHRMIQLQLHLKGLTQTQSDRLAGLAPDFHPFELKLSGEKEWLIIEELETLAFDVNTKILQLTLSLGPEVDPVTGLPADAEGYLSPVPTLKIELKEPAINFQGTTAIALFTQLSIEKVVLSVKVKGLIPSAIRNDNTILDAEEAFEPFGSRPSVGSRFYFTHPELIAKRLDEIKLTGDWIGGPSTKGKLNEKYKGYTDQEGVEFKTQFCLFDRGTIIQKQAGIPLFTEENRKLKLYNQIIFENTADYKAFPNASTDKNVLGSDRYFALVLEKPDFGHHDYPSLVQQKTTALAAAIANQTAPGVPEVKAEEFTIAPPYTPELQNLEIQYAATVELWPDHEVQVDAKLLHLHPFGYAEATNKLMPSYSKEGALYIGLEQLSPPTELSVLFQMAAGSSNPDVPPPAIQWDYLVDNQWQALNEKGRILLDETNGLLNSGIIRFFIPEEANTEHNLLPGGLHWLRASIAGNNRGVSDVIGIHTQAVSATFDNRDNDPEHLNQPLAPESIKKLYRIRPEIKSVQQPYSSFGGQAEEPISQFYTRVSERLRHKNRALTIWDYERLVLQHFPEVYKVKCLNPAATANQKLGQVELIVVPNIKGIRPFDPFEPKVSVDRLEAIRSFLQNKAAPQAKVVVRNPTYVPIKIKVSVALLPQFQLEERYYLDLLHEALLRFLAPWAYDAGAEISIGGIIYPNLIVNFIDRLPYVDFIRHFRMQYDYQEQLHLICKEDMEQGVPPLGTDIIWVSARAHDVNTKELNVAGLGIGCMSVQNDLQIA